VECFSHTDPKSCPRMTRRMKGFTVILEIDPPYLVTVVTWRVICERPFLVRGKARGPGGILHRNGRGDIC
jgi:hypothetical protein